MHSKYSNIKNQAKNKTRILVPQQNHRIRIQTESEMKQRKTSNFIFTSRVRSRHTSIWNFYCKNVIIK